MSRGSSLSRRARRDTSLRTGAIVLVLGVLVFAGALAGGVPLIGDGGGQTVRASLRLAPQLNEKTPVRVGGVDVGRVESVQVAHGGRAALVTLRITDDAVRVRSDATVALLYRTLLGGRFEVSLDPGSPSAPALGDRVIPEDRTRSQTEVDDVARIYDPPAVEGQRVLLEELAAALDGKPAGRAVDVLGPGLRPVGPALRELRGRRHDDVEVLVQGTASTLRVLHRNDVDLRGLIADGATTFGATSGARADLGRTLRSAPAALAATRRIAGDIDRTLPDLQRLVADLRPAAGPLARAAARTRPVAVALDDILRGARPLLRRLRPAVADLASASRAGRRLVAGLAPAIARIDDELIPYLEGREGDTGLPVHQLFAPTIASLGSITSEFDDLGYVAHFPIQLAENSVSLVPCTTSLTDPSPQQESRCAGVEELLTTLLPGGGR